MQMTELGDEAALQLRTPLFTRDEEAGRNVGASPDPPNVGCGFGTLLLFQAVCSAPWPRDPTPRFH